MCSRVDVVEKFAAFIIVIDEMMEAEGLAETWVNFCLIRGVTSQKRVWCNVHNFFFLNNLLLHAMRYEEVYCMPTFSLL